MSKNDTTENIRPEAIPKGYRDRLKILRKGQEFYQQDDIPKAVDYYTQYLMALAQFHKVEEPKLSPKFFDKEKELAELLLISHVYWDLAKAYDRSPNLHNESVRCLDQFVKFTTGYKYQYVNARMLRNYIRKRMAHNSKAFKQAYERIQVESKGCFIASDIYGFQHANTKELRDIKLRIVQTNSGRKLAEFYYQTICPIYFNLFELSPSAHHYMIKKPLSYLLSTSLFLKKALKK